MIASYPSLYALGHKALTDLLKDPVTVQEKIDGSQLSFGLYPETGYKARSKGAELHLEAPEKLFSKACEVIQMLPLREGWTYRGEYLQKPKHNTLVYDRTPEKHIILFDINCGHEDYLSPEMVKEEAARIGLETVPTFYEGELADIQMFRDLLEHTSCLGGAKVEGVVIKNYHRFGPDKKVLMGKFVSEAFKEVHAGEWKTNNPSKTDLLQSIISKYKTPARWQKAVQHLKEAGTLEQSPKDIGHLIKEVQQDIEKECAEEIKELLAKQVMPHVLRGTVAGLPEWYKGELIKLQFEEVS